MSQETQAAVSQSEFARLLNVGRSYITALKAAGRLVMTEDGKVDVEASRQRISETADPNRDDVVSRWAAERGQTGLQATQEASASRNEQDDDEPATGTYAEARARKENALADMAEMERDKEKGRLIERVAVEAAIEDVMTIVRQAVEQQPHRVAPMLIGQDLETARAILKQENYGMLAGMVKEFQQRIRQMAGEDE